MSNPDELDGVLLQRAHRGDSRALERLALRWWAPVYRIAWNMLGSAAEAADASEQTFRLAVRFPESIGDVVPFGLSLRGAAIDLLLLRSPPSPRFAAPAWPIPPGDDWSERYADVLRRPELAGKIRAMIQRLDALDRAAYTLRELEELSVEDAVRILRIPEGEVRARSHRALVQLTALLGRCVPKILHGCCGERSGATLR